MTLEGLLAAVYEGMRLTAILACLGATNALASPRRLLRYVPATLYEVGTAVVVALTFAPQLSTTPAGCGRPVGSADTPPRESPTSADSRCRCWSARWTGRSCSPRRWSHGDTVGWCNAPTSSTRTAAALTLVGLTGVVVGLYGLMDGSSPVVLGAPMLLAGVLCAVAALAVGARHDARSHYRRDRWGGPEWLAIAAGFVPAAGMVIASTRGWAGVVPVQVPVHLPDVPLVLVALIAVGALAGVFTPVPPGLARQREAAP